MAETVIINPVTRISGFMEIKVEIENHIVADAKCSGLLFRGFERMLKGRPPLDAIYFTERICGICSTAHSMASSLALEEALGVLPELNDKYIRDFMHGCEFIQNHIRHFYQYTLPDYVRGVNISALRYESHDDFRLPQKLDNLLTKHYFESLEYSRMAHEMLAALGGKAPHNHGIFAGGVTVDMEADKYIKVKSILDKIIAFVEIVMIYDANIIGEYYPEYYFMGEGYGNLLSYGVFDYQDKEIRYISPRVFYDGIYEKADLSKVTESIYSSWYKAPVNERQPPGQPVEEDFHKDDAYTWVKCPRYEGLPMEVGPLARMFLSGDYRRGISAMDRTMARVLEIDKIGHIMKALLNRIELKRSSQRIYDIPQSAKGTGLIDTTRGALGHWIAIEDKKISNYDIITPTAWNLSPHDSKGLLGPVEKALAGTRVEDIKNPVELGRIARTFDPCVSCATHVISDEAEPFKIKIV
ncbi:nickel-dependent hydrogenase large subunit [Lutispora saccharofermentans]|uniref:Nickel-dependent hydrogenase large subunit n=1 Tax=Lutispora saccharofermentans TaxID=3024236 RepID=A0ABT1NEF1_9FIRM|nr:nickel-dependent hydrogenase large subunit [Lutispora saccharofermentans]MCQ1529603.1 nickel-dependent hydrogenase large subunit [Lutispora saccharofermentans]